MKVTTIVEKEGNMFQFTAELSSEQHAFLLDYAIRDLVQKGLLALPTPSEDGQPVQEAQH